MNTDNNTVRVTEQLRGVCVCVSRIPASSAATHRVERLGYYGLFCFKSAGHHAHQPNPNDVLRWALVSEWLENVLGSVLASIGATIGTLME